MSGFTARWKYYFIRSISEASIIVSGLGFSGLSDSSPLKPLWDRAENVDIVCVGFASSAVQQTSRRLATTLGHVVADVYYKLIEKGKKPGFFRLPATQTDSAVWHVSYRLAFVGNSMNVVVRCFIWQFYQFLGCKFYP
ncbi:hypothetical protein B296_00056676 [Ensete ventricosum]|uniref:Uncharacterized protein n=1 Tax=Ensete ventricosum TaxID=4639 RepID=A0A426XJ24_ENSVE|nr:hypothetical protein B296_00056676 [Ensete ventricosum]